MATTTTNPSIGTSPRTQDLQTDKILPSNRGIYWAIGIAIVLLFIVFAMRPISNTPATSTTGTIMSETAIPTDENRGATYDDGTVNNATDTNIAPTQRR